MFEIMFVTCFLLKNGPGLKMFFLLKMGIFQPAMLVYQRIINFFLVDQKRRCYAPAMYAVSLHNWVESKSRSLRECLEGVGTPQMPREPRDLNPSYTP